MLLVIAVALVGLWPVNSQQIIEGYLTPAADSSEARNLLVPPPHGENFNSPLIGLFYVTPEEAADLPPGKPIRLTVYGFLAGDLSSPVSQISQISQISLEGTVMAPPGSFGYTIDLLTLRQRHPPSLRGQTLGQLKRLAESYGMQTKALKVNLAGLKLLKTPAVLHWDRKHFVILKKATTSKIVIHDPAQGIRSLTWEQVSQHFSGVALELAPGTGFKREDHRVMLTLRDFFANNDLSGDQNTAQDSSLKSGLALLLLLSLGLLFVASLLPLGNRLMIDQVLKQPGTNQEDPYPWLVLLVSALVGISTISMAISTLRSYLLLHLTNILSSHLSTKVFHHLLGLPLA